MSVEYPNRIPSPIPGSQQGSMLIARLVSGWVAIFCFIAINETVSGANLSEDGYRGIWFTLGQNTTYGDKYSGGLGTYTCSHIPMAVYAPKANKTFFVYGGTKPGKKHLLNMISFFDHEKGLLPRPVIVHDKQTVNDPHDNPSLQIDGLGYLWVFVSGRAKARPGFIYRSSQPYQIDSFELIKEDEMTYPQPWRIDNQDFLFLFTRYTKGRELYWSYSKNGQSWSAARKLAGMGGHYQISNLRGHKIVTAFNWHPGGNVDKRTNLYLAQTEDFGNSWYSVDGQLLNTPLTNTACAALVKNYAQEKRLVYLMDLQFDLQGNPVILYLTSNDYAPGPSGDPRIWTLAFWNRDHWDFSEVTSSTHNYDMGSLYLEPDGSWKIIGPTEPGPQRLGTGGEMAFWISKSLNGPWQKSKLLTHNSEFNHAYARRPLNAHPDFYAFWADGNPDKFSPSRLYFCNQSGDKVWRMPYQFDGKFVKPELLNK